MRKVKATKMPRAKANKQYKKKIYGLCKRAANGDESAIKDLDRETDKSQLAVWSVKHWMKVRKIPIIRKKEKVLTKEQQALHDRVQKMGFHDGASVPGSNIRKVTK